MKLSLFSVLFVALSSNAFAMSNKDLENECMEVGKEKIIAQEESSHCVADITDVKVKEVDNRWYNPSKYIWYQASGDCNGSEAVTVLVQYSEGKCF